MTYDPIAEDLRIALSESLNFERDTETKQNTPTSTDPSETVQVPTSGVNPTNNQDALRALQRRVTWTWRDVAWDKDAGDLAASTADQTVDISAIVGTGKKLVILEFNVSDGLTNSYIDVKPMGYTNPMYRIITQVASNPIPMKCMLETNADGEFEIKTSPAPASWDYIRIAVRGSRDA